MRLLQGFFSNTKLICLVFAQIVIFSLASNASAETAQPVYGINSSVNLGQRAVLSIPYGRVNKIKFSIKATSANCDETIPIRAYLGNTLIGELSTSTTDRNYKFAIKNDRIIKGRLVLAVGANTAANACGPVAISSKLYYDAAVPIYRKIKKSFNPQLAAFYFPKGTIDRVEITLRDKKDKGVTATGRLFFVGAEDAPNYGAFFAPKKLSTFGIDIYSFCRTENSDYCEANLDIAEDAIYISSIKVFYKR